MHHRRAALLVALALGVGITGCGSASSSPDVVVPSDGDRPWTPDDEAAPQATATTEDERLLARYGPPPLDAFTWSPEESDVVQQATDRALVACMAELGFEYAPEPEEEVPWIVTHWGDDLGIIDADQAASRGYKALGLDLPAPDTGPFGVSEAYLSALSDEGGCLDQAFDLTAGGDLEDPELLGRLWESAVGAARSDQTYLDAKKQWSACMAEAGYPLEDFPMPFENDEGDVQQAVTDVACKASSGVVDAYITALYAAETRLAEENAAALRAHRAAMEERVRLAAAVGS